MEKKRDGKRVDEGRGEGDKGKGTNETVKGTGSEGNK